MKYQIILIIETRRSSPSELNEQIWNKVNELSDVLVHWIQVKNIGIKQEEANEPKK